MESGLSETKCKYGIILLNARGFIFERTMCPEIEGTDSTAKMMCDMTNFPGNLHVLT